MHRKAVLAIQRPQMAELCFLDEIGELPLPAQWEALAGPSRQDIYESRFFEIHWRRRADDRCNEPKPSRRNDVDGKFREDLFHRLAVGVLRLPPIRERQGDLSPLIDAALDASEPGRASRLPGFKDKKLSAGARNLLLRHPWPGNVRELFNTLSRAAIWTPVKTSKQRISGGAIPTPGSDACRRDRS